MKFKRLVHMERSSSLLSRSLERRIRISTKGIGTMDAILTTENPRTAEEVWKALPIKGNANLWGDEIYFSTSVSLKEEHARAEVEVGAIAYWPPGKAVCIFFGQTPVSKHGEPRAASSVNVFAKVLGNPTIFRNVHDGDQLILAKADSS
ncbi:MAG TPA: cyclophilin-like fold protein [Candidatus Acidoferrales bacterium]|nr:cyclophilin-like fold protein [Candidatus Acidoferrales bacterium]